jgi:D-alanyl-D-alanine carboxypeptidase-like protein
MGKSLDALDSTFRPQVDDFLGRCDAEGIPLTVIDTDRTEEEQQQKLAQGVSWTQHSLHLPQPPEGKSKAIDVCPTVYLTVKNWNPTGDLWSKIGSIGEQCGMFWGGRWSSHPDPGHFQFKEVV